MNTRPRTLDFISFANWAIKNLLGESHSIFLDHQGSKVEAIEIDGQIIRADDFVCAEISNKGMTPVLNVEYFKRGACASRTYTTWSTKNFINLGFVPCKSVLDPTPGT